MEVKEILHQVQQQFATWKKERDQEHVETHSLDVEEFVARSIYDYAKYFTADADSLNSLVNGLYGLESNIFMVEVALDRFKRIYEQIDTQEEPRRTRRLSDLMSEMERTFNIPMLNSEQFNKDNVKVMELYWDISYARDL